MREHPPTSERGSAGDVFEEIQNDALKAYGSLSSPDWSFVEKRYRNHPYIALIEKFARAWPLRETTDLNYDLSVVIYLGDSDAAGFNARFSLVGKYACLSNSSGRFLSRVELANDDFARNILALVREEGVTLLDPEELSALMDFGGASTTVYEVLFSTVEAA